MSQILSFFSSTPSTSICICFAYSTTLNLKVRESEKKNKIKSLRSFFSFFFSEPRIGRDHPLNLSISISGGRETNQDSHSNGDRSGKSSSLKSPDAGRRRIVAWRGQPLSRVGAVEVYTQHVQQRQNMKVGSTW